MREIAEKTTEDMSGFEVILSSALLPNYPTRTTPPPAICNQSHRELVLVGARPGMPPTDDGRPRPAPHYNDVARDHDDRMTR